MYIKSINSFQRILDEYLDSVLNVLTPDYPAANFPLGISSAPNINGVTIASAATITLDYFMTKVSGAVNTSAIKIPTGLRGLVRVIICTGALPLVTGGVYVASDGTYETLPLAIASTGAANKPILLFSDGLQLWPLLTA